MTEQQVESLLEALSRRPDLKARLAATLSSPPGAVDGRFEAILAEIRDLRADFNARMDASNARMDASNARMDASNARIEKLQEQVRDLRADFNTRMDASNARIEKLRQDFQEESRAARADFNARMDASNARMEKLRQDFQEESRAARAEFNARWEHHRLEFQEESRSARLLIERSQYQTLATLQAVAGGYRQRAGGLLEDTIAGLLRVFLGAQGIGPEHVSVRQRWRDEHGEHEIDLVVRDDVQYVAEVTWDLRDLRGKNVRQLSEKMDCAIRHWKLANAKKVLIAVEKDPDLPAECERLGLLLV